MKFLFLLLFFIICFAGISQQKKQYELYFDSGKEELTTSSKNAIDSFFNKIPVKNISSINIYGYCDSIGNTDYNNKLSIKRANSVKNYIANKGVIPDSIFIKGFGKTIQKYTSNKWNKNRRVSFEIYYKKKGTTKNVVNTPIKPVQSTPKDTIKTEIDRFVEKGEVGDKIALKNITFYGGSPEPMPESFATLKKLLNTLKENPTLEISIEGHICCHNNDDDNLSGRRALTVFDYLVSNGINQNRLSYKGFGHSQPLTQELTSQEQQINRRVEIRIVKK